MRKLMLSTVALAAVLAPFAAAAPALALNARSYVSNSGSDGASCATPATACATFDGALAKTAAGGDVSVVNTGDYGSIYVNKTVSITNDGAGEARVTPAGAVTYGVYVTAGVGDVVGLRGLVIDAQGEAGKYYGIFAVQASAMHIQNCVIRNFETAGGGFGILLQSSHNVQLFVSDTVIYNNGSTAATGGIVIQSFSQSSTNVVLDRVHLENNVRGLWVDGHYSTGNGAHVVIRDSVVSGNAGEGILASTVAGASPAFIMVERTASVNNAGIGIKADGPGATMLLDGDVVVRNGTGLSATNSGQLISYGNNKVNNNVGADGTPTGSYSPI